MKGVKIAEMRINIKELYEKVLELFTEEEKNRKPDTIKSVGSFKYQDRWKNKYQSYIDAFEMNVNYQTLENSRHKVPEQIKLNLFYEKKSVYGDEWFKIRFLPISKKYPPQASVIYLLFGLCNFRKSLNKYGGYTNHGDEITKELINNKDYETLKYFEYDTNRFRLKDGRVINTAKFQCFRPISNWRKVISDLRKGSKHVKFKFLKNTQSPKKLHKEFFILNMLKNE